MTLKDRVYYALLVFLSFFSFFPQYISSKIIAWLDTAYYFLPFRELTASLVRENIMPLWNPYIYCGNPLLANMQSAVFSPFSAFFYVLPADMAVKAVTFITYILIALFFYSFMRLNKVSEEGSFFSAAIFAFSYYLMVKAPELADIGTIAWLPAIMYFTKKYSISGKLYDFALLCAAGSMSLLGGHLQVFFYIYLLFAAYFFFECGYLKKELKKTFKKFAVFNAVIFALLLIQLVPTVKFILLSRRADAGFVYGINSSTYMNFENIAIMIFPFLEKYFPPAALNMNWMGLIDTGVLPVLLFLLGAWMMKDKKTKFFLLSVFLFSFILAFLGNLPFYRELYENVFIFRIMRYPGKINLLYFFAACMISGYGFDILFTAEKKKLKAFFIFLASCTGLLVAAVAAGSVFKLKIIGAYRNIFEPGSPVEKIVGMVETYDALLLDFTLYAGFFALITGIIYLIVFKSKKPAYMKIAVIALAVTGMFLYHRGWANLYAETDDIKQNTKLLRFLKSDPDINRFRVLAPDLIGKEKVRAIYSDAGEVFHYSADHLMPNIPMLHNILNADGFDSLAVGRFKKINAVLNRADAPWELPLFSQLSVKYIASVPEQNSPALKPAAKGWTNLYEYKNPLEPAYFISAREKIYFADNDGKAEEILSKKGFDPRKELVVSGGRGPEPSGSPPAVGGAEIELSMDSVNSCRIEIKNRDCGYLVLNDTYYPGWKVIVDGEKAQVLRANLAFRAVYLDDGAHVVEFRYAPGMFFTAAFAEFVIIILILVYSALVLFGRGRAVWIRRR